MPTPEGLNTTTLHGLYVEPDATSTPLQGNITFTPNPSFITFPTQNVIIAGTESVDLDVNGEFTITLVSTVNAGSNPSVWLYTVSEKIIGQRPRTYNIALPYNSGVTLELSDIVPTEDAPTYIPVVGPQGPPGVITTINGYSAASVTLSAADVQAVGLTGDQTATGTKTLSRLRLVDLSDVSLTSTTHAFQIGPDTGVNLRMDNNEFQALNNGAVSSFTINADGGNLNLFTSRAGGSVTDTLVVTGRITANGVDSSVAPTVAANLTRKDYVDNLDTANVKLTGTQTITALKTFEAATATGGVLQARVTADANSRLFVRADGRFVWGDGTVAQDTNLYRNGVGILKTDTALQVGGLLTALAGLTLTGTLSVTGAGNFTGGQVTTDQAAPTSANHLTRKDYVDNNFNGLTTAQTISGVKTFTAAPIFQAASAGTVVTNYKVTGDTNSRQTITSDGVIAWGPGNAATDVSLSRPAATAILDAVGGIQAHSAAGATTATAFSSFLTSDGFDRWRVFADGKVEWGSGALARDTNLYRSAADTLKTDDSLIVVGNITAANFPSGAWTSWTPTWATTTGSATPSFGNATVNCKSLKMGRAVWFKMDIVFGTTTNFGTSPTGSDNWTFTLPYTAAANSDSIGKASFDPGSTVRACSGLAQTSNSDTTKMYINIDGVGVNGTTNAGGIADSVTPFTWASGMKLSVVGQYESAT